MQSERCVNREEDRVDVGAATVRLNDLEEPTVIIFSHDGLEKFRPEALNFRCVWAGYGGL